MNKMQTFGLVGLLVSTPFIAVNGAERDTLDNWRKAVSTNDFKKTLTNIRTLQEEWPAIHSVKHAINKDGEKALLQKDYRDIARTFLQGLENYEKELRETSPEAFCEGAEALLKVREQFLTHPSYVNYFLVDNINRVIFVNLGERLAKIGDVPVCYDRIVERLAEFRCDWSLFYELANEEYGINQISRAEIEKLSLEEKVDAIGKMVGQEQTFFIIPQDMHNLFGFRILEKRSSAAWLARLAVSDHAIGGFLPALLSYRRKAVHFTPTDPDTKILSVLGEVTRMPPTLMDGNPYVANMTKAALRRICSEKWRQQLGFSDLTSFTKEFIERQEEQEAEREAQREAQTGNPAK